MANTYLTRTQSSTGSETKGTFSAWVKRAGLSTASNMYTSYQANNEFCDIQFNSSDQLQVVVKIGGTDYLDLRTTRLFRDTSSFYHVLVAFDSTDSTQADRCKIYVNGTRETSFATNTNNVSSSLNMRINGSSQDPYIGSWHNQGNYFSGVMSHVHWVDGTAYAPTVFGSTDSTTGEWKINTQPSVTYGTNGFFILKDGNSVTDQSGNSNNFTVGGGTLTNTEDNPSNVFCTFNGVNPYSGTLSNGNLKMSQTSFNYNVQGTLGMESGKYYWEYKIDGAYGEFGVCEQGKAGQSDPQGNIGFYFLYNNGNTTGYIWNNATAGSQSSEITISAFASGMIINVAYDADNKALYIGQNGTWLNSGDPTSGASTTGALVTNLYPRFGGTIVPFCGHGTSSTTANYEANFGNGYFGTTAISSEGTNASGNGKFEYDVPTGYTALCTKGLNL